MRNVNLIILFFTINILSASAQIPVDWIRTYHRSPSDEFYDIYAIAGGGYITSGASNRNVWVTRIENDGRIVWSRIYNEGGQAYGAWSIIETENADFLTGMMRNRDFSALLINGDGDILWWNDYGDGYCHSLIELKSGEFLLLGHTPSVHDVLGQLIMIDGDGEEIWSTTYDAGERCDLYYMRETEGGVLLFGNTSWAGAPRPWLLKVDFNGEVIWEKFYNIGRSDGRSIAASLGGGFVLTGMVIRPNESNLQCYLIKIDDEGNDEWTQFYDIETDNSSELSWSVIAPDNGGYALVGKTHDEEERTSSMKMIRTNSDGEETWRRLYGDDRFYNPMEERLWSIIKADENTIIAAGSIDYGEDSTGVDGFIVKLVPELLEPLYISWSPVETEFSVLPGDEINFNVYVVDQQGDELSYQWFRNQEMISQDTTITITFEELGVDTVISHVTNGEFGASLTWLVTTEEFYIESFFPDSLIWTIQRTNEVEFALGVRAIEGMDLNYRWLMTDRDNRQIEVGDAQEMTYNFDLGGNFGLEGQVFNEQAIQSVVWQIDVNSVVWWWQPHEGEITIEVDEEIRYSVSPFNLESDSLSYLWMVDRINTHITVREFTYSFHRVGDHEVKTIVRDGRASERVRWTVTVIDPDGVNDDSDRLLPTEVTLYPASPNPFNSTTSIRYFLPRPANVRLTVYNSAGRMVQTLSHGMNVTGNHQAILHGEDLATGVYLIRLTSDDVVHSQKIILLR